MRIPSKIELSENQVNGLVNVASMRRMLALISNRTADARLLEDLRHPGHVRDADPTSPSETIVGTAARRLDQQCDYVFAGPIDTCDPELWLALRCIASDASLVALFPHLRFEGITPTPVLVDMAALAFDIASRAACARTRHTAVPQAVMTDQMVKRRTSTVTADIVSGRIGAWSLMTDILGTQTAMMSGSDWGELSDAHAALTIMDTAIAVNETLRAKGEPNADESSFEVMSFAYLTFADLWDARQRTSAENANLSEWSMPDLLEDDAKADATLSKSMSGLSHDGATDYVGLFGIEPIPALTPAPRAFVETLSAIYETQEHMYANTTDEGVPPRA